MKVLDPSALLRLQEKYDTISLLTQKILKDGGQVSRQDLLMFQSSLNLSMVEAAVNLQIILATQFREEDKHHG